MLLQEYPFVDATSFLLVYTVVVRLSNLYNLGSECSPILSILHAQSATNALVETSWLVDWYQTSANRIESKKWILSMGCHLFHRQW